MRRRTAPGLGPPVQIAYAVPDVVEFAGRWSRDLGVGPFFVRPHIELVDVSYRGRPAGFDHTSAYGQWGSIMLELVQDHGDGPSVVRDVYGPGQSGLHHLAFFVTDLEESTNRLVADGFSVAMTARTAGGVAFSFIDALATHAHMFELYERSDRLLEFYEMVAAAAEGWTGADPVRVV
jgi:hypothetical protein